MQTQDPRLETATGRLARAFGGTLPPIVREAAHLAARLHAGQTRDEGTPYVLHPLRVALSLRSEAGLDDPELAAAALLHDALEDTELTRDELRSRFGPRVAGLVELVTKAKAEGPAAKAARDEAYYRLVEAAGLDARALKVADRVDNLRGLRFCGKPDKMARYLRETREHLLPLARGVGGVLLVLLEDALERFEPFDAAREADLAAQWLGERVREAGSRGLVVGVSGGVDSAVTAALCRRACPDATLALLMPFSADDEAFTRRGREVCAALGLSPVVHPVGEAHRGLAAPFEGAAHPGLAPDPRLALGNLRARLRMATLYLWAGSLGYLVAGTGNLDEDFVLGYFTKYGDGGVDLSPLAAFHKSEVFALGRALGVPASVLEAPPSAGLWPGQTDEDELGMSYDEVEAVAGFVGRVPAAADDDRAASALAAFGLDGRLLDVARRVQRLRRANRHKLVPPPAYERRTSRLVGSP